ncbi:MotE family protein [Aureimonas populi]|uniref:MotE family protein n=1 Tax=Aureimonas populi TaxID=1701758 RepID=A0ABW5CIG6_9HYPH|nr:MotE family protein [Aureimonas populi]
MKSVRLALAGFTLLSSLAPAVLAQEGAPLQPRQSVRVIGEDGTEQSVAPVVLSDVERYCTAIADPAREAREALQSERLRELEAEVDKRIDELEAKRAEYQEWLDKREAFLRSTSSIMLDIYATMRPDAAAAQLAGIDREAAAAIIAKLKARQASAIMTEMPATVASELAGLIVKRTDRSADLETAGVGGEARS